MRPYRLAFGTVERYDTIIVAAMDGEGRCGLGEATALTGCTDETIEDAWRVGRQFAALRPVLGNGVACDLGCCLEAIMAAGHIDNAGEMNGFLKIEAVLLDQRPAFESGAIRLAALYLPRLNMENIKRSSVDSIRVARINGRTPARGLPA